MRVRLIFLFLLGAFIFSFGQKKAKDFTVTTTDKQKISLYKDFLDKGKVVMLKIFFVDCPPCNDIAPQVSNLYKKYGSGKDKVEFIELSNKAWDADPAVIGYKLKYDLPCPSASNDGGSVQAAALYSDNSYGPFFGTPTFVVIKPNGDVNFDPRGFNKNETINKLDIAIQDALKIIPTPVDTIKPTPVDTIKPTPVDTLKPAPIKIDTIKIAGKLVNTVGNSLTGLGFVNMSLTWNNKEYKFTTDIQGNFATTIFDSLKSNASATLKIEYLQAYNADVTVSDMLIVQRHILGITTITDFKKRLAADVNTDNDINVIDLLEMRKLILGVTEKLPNNTPSVYFIYQNPNNLIKSISNPIQYEELKALNGKQILIESIKTGNLD